MTRRPGPMQSLAREHEGLRIAHLSDLHLSGRITKEYFKQVVVHVNRCQPDLVAITGDVVERERCLDWIPETLGQLGDREIAGFRAGMRLMVALHQAVLEAHRLHRTG